MPNESKRPTQQRLFPTLKRRIALVRRVQRLGTRIGKLAEQKRLAIEELAKVTGVTEVDGRKYVVVEPTGRYVYFSKFELKELPKNPRSPQPESAPTAEAAL